MSDVLEQTKPRIKVRELPKIVFYNDGGIYFRHVRASYPHLDKPWSMSEKSEKKYQIMGLIPKTPEYDESVAALNEYIDNFLAERRLQPLPQSRKFLRHGEETGKPEMMGHWTLSAAERKEPRLIGRHIDPRTGSFEVIPPSEADKVFYGGCWVSILFRVWYQEHQEGGRRVNANLDAVQFIRNDTVFGRSRITDDIIDDTFEEVPDDEGGFEQKYEL